MPVTANRAASTWTPQLIGKAEAFFNQGGVEDLVVRNYLYYNELKKKGRVKVGKWGHTQTLAVNQLNQGGVTWFDHLDTITAPVQDGPQAASWYRAQCAKGLSYSATQEADNSGGNVDLLAFAVDTMVQDFLTDWNRTLIVGAGSSSKQPDGLEAAINPEDHATGTVDEITTWQMRQATNVYAGLDRSPFTSASAGGTNWENVSASFDATANSGWTNGTDNKFKWTAYGVPSASIKALDNVIASCADGGGMNPDIGLWTRKPFNDYKSMYPGTVQYARTDGGAASEFNLACDTIKHGSMTIGWSDEFAASGTYGDAAAGDDMLYLLNTDSVCILTEEGWNFAGRPWLPAQSQMASSMYLVWRGFHMVTNPRRCGVIFSYNKA